ncbi:MAG TPA: phosphoribosyl-AMP cyclohydrolase [Gammaproteobacteria bacterium]|nr:phosphoribosyl-AMP cyclohydrolase [Gammaproteobacteria bacterium]
MSTPVAPLPEWLDAVRFDAAGLVTAVAQDVTSGRVLMVAWMNREALALTQREGRAVYWSRSRGQIWRKGESSGHVQRVREIRLDCDGDTVLLAVEQVGGIACHTGREHCFFRRLDPSSSQWETTEAVRVDPEQLYGPTTTETS